jgi:TRAP-type C4-dicarboxylate transport system substrate-binding protein
MKLTIGLRTRSAALAMILAAASAGMALSQEVTLRLHQFLPAQAPVPAKVLVPWMEKITAESGGRIVFEHYPAMQLGGRPPELIDQVVDGVADVVWTLPGYTPGRFPRSEVFELPFMMTTAEATSAALWELAEAEMLDTEFKDVKVIGLWVHGPGVIHADTPAVEVGDLQGLNLRAPTRVTSNLITELGANAVGMPVPQVAESLSKGVIDGAIIPWEVTGAIKSSELVSNHTEFPGAPLYTAVIVLAINKAVYEGLPDDLKAVIDANSGLAFSTAAGATTEAADAGPRQVAVDRGNAIVQLNTEQIAAWKAAAEPTIVSWVAETSAAGLDGQGLVDRARAAISAHGGN